MVSTQPIHRITFKRLQVNELFRFSSDKRIPGSKCNMVTLEQATTAGYRQEFHHVSLTNRDGTPVRCRVNGKCKTWKRSPGRFRLPVKYGLKECFYITERNAHEWTIA